MSPTSSGFAGLESGAQPLAGTPAPTSPGVELLEQEGPPLRRQPGQSAEHQAARRAAEL